jgi:hypothetical protein
MKSKPDHDLSLLREGLPWDLPTLLSPSPRPSPLGRGGNVFRLGSKPKPACWPTFLRQARALAASANGVVRLCESSGQAGSFSPRE